MRPGAFFLTTGARFAANFRAFLQQDGRREEGTLTEVVSSACWNPL
jgi:hypothetical protein